MFYSGRNSFNAHVFGQLKNFTYFPKLKRSWNAKVISRQPLYEMPLEDL
jgi:hypothetical protein